MSSTDLSDCSSSSKFSDCEVHTKSKLSEKAVNIAAISDNENFEKSNDSRQTTDHNKKKITKSQITDESEINEENQNILSFETNNNTEGGISHSI